MCLAQGPQRSDSCEALTRPPQSPVKHSTTEPLRCLRMQFKFILACLSVIIDVEREKLRKVYHQLLSIVKVDPVP